MNFGEKLRQLRKDRKLTQPELADAIGIEQSYLSKLENDKYVPSSEVFGRILEEFGLSVGDLVDELDSGSRLRFRQIPEVASHFTRQKERILGNRRSWLLGSAILLAVGAALVYGGGASLFVPGIVYQYQSYGVVLENESKEIFPHSGNPFRAVRPGHTSLGARLDEEFVSTRRFRGSVYNVEVEGGSRTYYLVRQNDVDSWVNKAAAALGVLLFVLGATGLVLEKKLSRYQ